MPLPKHPAAGVFALGVVVAAVAVVALAVALAALAVALVGTVVLAAVRESSRPREEESDDHCW